MPRLELDSELGEMRVRSAAPANHLLQQTGAALRFFEVQRFLCGPGC